ncbi:uncharacterized protein FFB14_03223 [Fusarium fujikuroi]|nr:uncharacterized protein FFB14_03223 [Fusarium fujikuroi]
MMENPDCGLVIDSIWGETQIIFPFTIYEAKKQVSSTRDAVQQISHACRAYPAILDDLARNPNDVSKYQDEPNDRYQIFTFTSCKANWEVFTAWNFYGECLIEEIWDGDVNIAGNAMSLKCLVDQIRNYAIYQHRPFVMRHFKAWLL